VCFDKQASRQIPNKFILEGDYLMRPYKSIYLLVYFLFFCTSVHTANHYVDKNANGNNNGTSWTNAWVSFSDINWDSVNAGDTVWISGGSSGQTYTEQLNVQASGNPNQDVVVRSGLSAGHNGTVTVQRDNHSSGYGFNITNQKYVTLSNMTFTESRYGGLIRGTSVRSVVDITLDSLIITQFGADFKADGFGIFINGWGGDDYNYIDSVNVTNCTISIVDSLYSQTDGIHAKFMKNFYMDNTDILIDNRSYVLSAIEPNHNDCVQFFSATANIGVYNITIKNSRLRSLAGVDTSLYINNTLHSQNVQTHDLGGTIILYNNTIENPYGFGYTNMIYDRNVEHDEHWIIVHNTINSRSSSSMTTLHDDDVILKNNIFYTDLVPNGGNQFKKGFHNIAIDVNQPITAYTQIDGNLWSTNCYQSGSSNIISVSGGKSMAKLVAAGGESSGNFLNRDRVDPLFVQYTSSEVRDGTGGTWDLHLQSGSPAINEGANLQSFIEELGLEWIDKDGILRDSTPDCGAYQYVP